jgi:hypothetical protein
MGSAPAERRLNKPFSVRSAKPRHNNGHNEVLTKEGIWRFTMQLLLPIHIAAGGLAIVLGAVALGLRNDPTDPRPLPVLVRHDSLKETIQ